MAAMDKAVNTIIPYEDERGKAPYMEWLHGLRDRKARGIIAEKVAGMARAIPKKETKSVGGGVSELRIHYGPGYRVYFAQQRGRVYILLCGGDKSSQRRDIKRAQAYWQDHKRRNRV